MPADVMTERLAALLRPYLGSTIVDHTALCRRAALVLAQFGHMRISFGALQESVEEVLFDELYTALGDRMTLRLDNGQDVRIWLQQLPEIADLAMQALFELLPVYSGNYHILTDYMLSSSSLSVMRVLYERYRTFLSAEEAARLRRVLLERWPGERDWLREA